MRSPLSAIGVRVQRHREHVSFARVKRVPRPPPCPGKGGGRLRTSSCGVVIGAARGCCGRIGSETARGEGERRGTRAVRASRTLIPSRGERVSLPDTSRYRVMLHLRVPDAAIGGIDASFSRARDKIVRRIISASLAKCVN